MPGLMSQQHGTEHRKRWTCFRSGYGSATTRNGSRPTTPRSTKFIKALLADPAVRVSKGSSYENRDNLAPSFFTEILARYEGTRLGAQEINADVLGTSEAAVFQNFSEALNVTEKAELAGGHDVYVAVDCGTSRYTAAVWAQCFERDRYRKIVTVFADYLAVDKTSSECADEIKQLSATRQCAGQIRLVLLDPAASARSALGPAARGECARVFGERMIAAWLSHRVHDGVDQVEILIGDRSASQTCTSTLALRGG
jgi:hypothetical protein